MIKYSVIIPARNAEKTIASCIKSLKNQSIDQKLYEVIVIDDGSKDKTAEIASREGVITIKQKPIGPAAARNAGAKIARGDILLFTDADCQPEFNWIEEMVKPFANEEIVGVKGAYITEQKSLTARFVQLEYEDKYQRMKKFNFIDFIDTYSAAFKKNVFLAAGGYDESFTTSSVEDQEFSFRLAKKNFKMVFNERARVKHIHVENPFAYAQKKFKIAFWKSYLLRIHPQKAIWDTHTPQILKVQMGIADLILILFVLFIISNKFTLSLLTAIFAFLITTFPFIKNSIRKDPTISFLSPIFLFIRSISLSLGLLCGSLVFLFKKR